MTMRILVSLAVLALVLSPSITLAEDAPGGPSAEFRKSLTEFLDLVGATEAGEQISYAIANETLAAIAATGVSITTEIKDVVLEESLNEFGKLFGDANYLTDIYAPLYAEHFDEKEIAELLAFYKSPVGKKTLVAMPTIGQTGSAKIQQASSERIPDFQIRVDERLRKSGLVTSE